MPEVFRFLVSRSSISAESMSLCMYMLRAMAEWLSLHGTEQSLN